MKRVASLYLPSWSIDRLRRIERRRAPSAEADSRAAFHAIGADAAAERAQQCSVPKQGGWRPGARWARNDPDSTGNGLAETRTQVEQAIEAMPAHRRPPQRELGRTSEVADNPFGRKLSRPPEERVAPPLSLREMARRTEAAEPLFRPGTRGWMGEDLQTAVNSLPAHQRPRSGELSRKTEVLENPFRLSPDDVGPNLRHGRPDVPPLRFPGEDAPAKSGRGAALRDDGAKRDRHRNQAPSIARLADLPTMRGTCEDVTVRRATTSQRRSARDGHGGEAGYVAPPNLGQSLKQLAAMPAVQFPGEGPHPDNHGRSAPTAPTYGQGRFFQTGRTLASVVSRVCQADEPDSFERTDHEEPPLVTTRKCGSRVDVAAANMAALSLGIGPGTALTMARAQLPGLEVREADPEGDAAELAALAERLARRWAPIVAISDADGLFIDLTGVGHLHGGEAGFCRKVLRLLKRHGIAARVAVADTAGAAWAITRFAQGSAHILPPGTQQDALAQLPVAALRLDPATLELLARLGIDRIEQLTALPRAPLVRRFGRLVADRIDQALGRLPEPLVPVDLPTRVMVEQRFAEPIATAEAIAHWLGVLMERMGEELAKTGQGARLVEMVAARIDGVPQRLRLGFARPTRDVAHMLRLTLRRIEEIEPGYGIDAISLLVRRADPLGPQTLSPELAEQARPDIAPLIDTLANRIGTARLWRAAPVESEVPERSWTCTAPLGTARDKSHSLQVDDVRRLDASAPDHPWHPRWPRPVLLLQRPERIDHVLAEMPDQPPRRFTWRGTTHRVIRAEGPERVAGEWWRRAAEREAVRDYFRVEDDAGQRFWLFRRGDGMRSETGDLSWFLHGLCG
ncbi:protein ImuB [Sphingomonas jejuensis]|uniref:DNA-directed DNA polymerase n=1 Tax=Sphingomonas jejuensis TaxID=904715 RepID=A0ABX0XIU5_9SPHN|nr:DNA polymerase Y family protein [Sphingomonas jejuensis]NJC32731.1 protein ImuB [Sphingomonas jejuensis]